MRIERPFTIVALRLITVREAIRRLVEGVLMWVGFISLLVTAVEKGKLFGVLYLPRDVQWPYWTVAAISALASWPAFMTFFEGLFWIGRLIASKGEPVLALRRRFAYHRTGYVKSLLRSDLDTFISWKPVEGFLLQVLRADIGVGPKRKADGS